MPACVVVSAAWFGRNRLPGASSKERPFCFPPSGADPVCGRIRGGLRLSARRPVRLGYSRVPVFSQWVAVGRSDRRFGMLLGTDRAFRKRRFCPVRIGVRELRAEGVAVRLPAKKGGRRGLSPAVLLISRAPRVAGRNGTGLGMEPGKRLRMGFGMVESVRTPDG